MPSTAVIRTIQSKAISRLLAEDLEHLMLKEMHLFRLERKSLQEGPGKSSIPSISERELIGKMEPDSS